MISLSKKLIGNENLIKNLIFNFDNNTLPNSIILTGEKGTGKATLAFNLIYKIFDSLSQNRLNNNQTNLIYKNSHPNVKYITKELDNKTEKIKNYITVGQIRNLNNFFHQSSFDSLPKFIIIDAADDLNLSSANALLKSLEEPKMNHLKVRIVRFMNCLI